MKKVFIDNSKRLVLVDGKKVPRLLLGIMRGAIGKSFVVKHYKGGRIVVTKFPYMKEIVASEQQREKRDLFREAVVYAKWILADAERKKVFKKSLPRRKQGKVYQAAIQLYMRMQGDKQWLRKQLAVKAVAREQLAMSNMQWAIYNVRLAGGNGHWVDFRQQGTWRVVWEKNATGRVKQENNCVVALRI